MGEVLRAASRGAGWRELFRVDVQQHSSPEERVGKVYLREGDLAGESAKGEPQTRTSP